MSTANIAKLIVRDAYNKTSQLGFHKASKNQSTNKDIESSIYQPVGGYLDRVNPKPISDSLSARVLKTALVGVAASAAAWVFTSKTTSYLSQTSQILWDALPEKSKDRLLACRSWSVDAKRFIWLVNLFSYMETGSTVWTPNPMSASSLEAIARLPTTPF
jgi:hypothetical protein